MEIEDRVLVFIRYFNVVKLTECWRIGGMSRDDFEYYKNFLIRNRHHGTIYEIQLIKPKFIPTY